MTSKSMGSPGESQWTTVVLRLIVGNRQRSIGKRFFGVASSLVFVTTVLHPANIAFTTKLTMVVAVEAAVALLAILMIKFERGASRKLSKKPSACKE